MNTSMLAPAFLIGLLRAPIAVPVVLAEPTAEPSALSARESPISLLPFALSPDGRFALYGGGVSGGSRLLSLRLADGTEADIGPPPGQSGFGSYVDLSPVSTKVLFVSTVGTGVPNRLFAVPIEGPAEAAIELSLPAEPPYDAVHEWSLAPSESHAFYNAARTNPFRIDLFAVPSSGPASESQRLNAVFPDGQTCGLPIPLSTANEAVFFCAHSPEGWTVWLSDLDEPNPVEIGGPPIAPGSSIRYPQVAPDEQRVVWAEAIPVDFALLSAPISDAPGDTVKLNPDAPAGRSVEWALVSPGSDWVVYLANERDPNLIELFSVPIAGPAGEARNLNGLYFTSIRPPFPQVAFSPDGAWVVYVADRELQGRMDLYRVPVAGPASENVRLNQTATPASWVYGFAFPEWMSVVFAQSDGEPTPTMRCWRASMSGPEASAEPLWVEPLLWTSTQVPCEPVPEIAGVLAVAADPTSGMKALWLAHLEGPPDLRPLKLIDQADYLPGWDPFWSKIEATSDGRFVVHVGTRLDGESRLWVLPLPLFWDGFESGGTLHWIEEGP